MASSHAKSAFLHLLI